MKFNRFRYQPDRSNVLGRPQSGWQGSPFGRSFWMESYGGPHTRDNPPASILVSITHIEPGGGTGFMDGITTINPPATSYNYLVDGESAGSLRVTYGAFHSVHVDASNVAPEPYVEARAQIAFSNFAAVRRVDCSNILISESEYYPGGTLQINSITIVM